MVGQEGFSTNSSSSKESDGYVYDINKKQLLFMAMDTKPTNTENEDNQKEKSYSKEQRIDGEVNLEEELVSTLK
jgi:hypothetical protein